MIRSQQAQLPDALERWSEVGASIDGYRVERVLSTRPGLHTLVEASAPDGQRLWLKVLAKPLTGDKELRRRLRRLARLRASIEHPHLLPLLPLKESGRRLYLASPAAGTRTLADRLCEGPLEVEESMRLLGQVAGALEAAGRRGLVHRELAPENILLTEDDPTRALLTDFGIGIPPSRRCELFGAVEAVDYRSPEELRGEPLDAQSNAYSLACILVECLTGVPPYPYDRPLLTLHAHLVNPPPRVSERKEGLSPELDRVVATGLAKDPSERYGTAARLIRAAREAAGVDAPIPVVPAKRERSSARVGAAPAEKKASRPSRRGSPRRDEARPAPEPRARPARERRAWSARPRAALVMASLALLVSAGSGFALGTTGTADTGSSESTSAVSREARDQRARLADYVSKVDQAVDELGSRRAAARRRLRGAERPAGQAAQAEALAAAYSKAGKALAGRPPAEASAAPPIGRRLRATARAYRRLAAAARKRDRRAWRKARDEALESERDLQRALGTLQRA